MQRWAFVAIQAVLSPTERLNAASYCICAQCFEDCYCSSECQKAAWPLHKERRCVTVGEADEDWKFRASFVGLINPGLHHVFEMGDVVELSSI